MANGSIVRYASPLKLTINAHTTLYAVYANATSMAKPVAGFTSVTWTNDGESISAQTVAAGNIGVTIYCVLALCATLGYAWVSKRKKA